MTLKILITGLPRSGKSTLITMLINYYKGKRTIFGFLTPEVRVNYQRIGFDVEDIRTTQRIELARIDNSYTDHFKVGKYRVFVEKFEEYIANSLIKNLEPTDLIIIDEIGKMELFSEIFQDYIKNLFISDVIIIATIGDKIRHLVKDHILKVPEVKLFHLTRQNQTEIYNNIISLIL